ncbi:TdcA1-ORF2 protein [Corchorus olitorius]|uniref:TdcA1-ORF2 protein n=1 Tax=Corchorus olitorius TaxID=93759 RepID=A0A1R3G3R0_9ROSI|nr:TdcA1-ORF2 protein [Corchorus olitorius]
MAFFANHFFQHNNERIDEETMQGFSIFNYPGRAHGQPKIKWLTDQELHVAHTYILRNCQEVKPFYEMFVTHLQDYDAKVIDSMVQNPYNQVTDPLLISLAWGPHPKVTTWSGYLINGYNFHTLEHGEKKATMNSGVCMQGSSCDETTTDFYGLLEDIIQIQFEVIGRGTIGVVLFKCKWFDPDPVRGMKIHPLWKKYSN